MIDDFLIDKNFRCPHCEGILRSQVYEPAESPQATSFNVDLKCSQCNRSRSLAVNRVEFKSWVLE
jgi:transcription elongation factor Elf1